MNYLEPNLLSTGEIIQILLKRQLKIPNIEHLNREELITIFNKFIKPLDKREEHEFGRTNRIMKKDDQMDVAIIDEDHSEFEIESNKPAICNNYSESASNTAITKFQVNFATGNTLKRTFVSSSSDSQILKKNPIKRQRIMWP